MSARAIREATGKRLLNQHLPAEFPDFAKCRFASVDEQTNWSEIQEQNSWINQEVRITECLILSKKILLIFIRNTVKSQFYDNCWSN